MDIQIIDQALDLNRTIAKLTKELEALKGQIREAGLAQAALKGENSATLEGSAGVAQVVCVKDVIKARKGADLLASESSLPEEVWSSLFVKVTKVEIAPDFEAKLEGLSKAQKAVVGNLVESVPQTARVTLK